MSGFPRANRERWFPATELGIDFKRPDKPDGGENHFTYEDLQRIVGRTTTDWPKLMNAIRVTDKTLLPLDVFASWLPRGARIKYWQGRAFAGDKFEIHNQNLLARMRCFDSVINPPVEITAIDATIADLVLPEHIESEMNFELVWTDVMDRDSPFNVRRNRMVNISRILGGDISAVIPTRLNGVSEIKWIFDEVRLATTRRDCSGVKLSLPHGSYSRSLNQAFSGTDRLWALFFPQEETT